MVHNFQLCRQIRQDGYVATSTIAAISSLDNIIDGDIMLLFFFKHQDRNKYNKECHDKETQYSKEEKNNKIEIAFEMHLLSMQR